MFEKIDLRVQNFDVPPQEVSYVNFREGVIDNHIRLDSYQGQRNGVRQCNYVLQGTVGKKMSARSVMFFNQVKDPISAVTNVDDYSGSARYQPAKINLKLSSRQVFFLLICPGCWPPPP